MTCVLYMQRDGYKKYDRLTIFYCVNERIGFSAKL